MKIYIFGSTGMLGRYVYDILNKKYQVKCITRKDFDIINDNFFKLENIMINLQNEDIVINCSGIIPQKVEYKQYKQYIRVNTLFPHKLNEICEKYNSKLIHITTDCVYNGKNGNYTTNSIHDSETIYGISKSLGEPENSTIIRTSIIGEEISNKKSLLEWVLSNKNKTIQGYTNHYWNGITCLTLSKIIEYMIENNIFWKGVKNIFSPEIVSKYDLCSYINELYELNIKIIPVENDYKNLTLSGINEFKIENIKKQLHEQKNYIFNI